VLRSRLRRHVTICEIRNHSERKSYTEYASISRRPEIMKLHPHGAAKRPIFSLLFAASLSGCAVYSPYPADYSYSPAYYSGYYPYGYGYGPAYSGAPYYVGPPVSLDLWFSSGYGGYHGYGHGHGHGFHGGHHGGGHHGGWGGGHHGGWGGRHH
jgi:hypothetical protein